MTRAEAKARRQAEDRWCWAKTFVEPNIKEACNDDSALGFLPNHEAQIRSWSYAQCLCKCRKTAFSWGIALDALARAATEIRSTGIIISIDEREAREKFNFIQWIYAALLPSVRRELKLSGGTEELRTANGSRVQFLAHKAPTGSGATIYADEFSIEPKHGDSATDILTAAIGCTTHSGYIRIGGTERGPLTIFHQIVTGKINEMIAEGVEGLEGIPKVEWDVRLFEWWKSPALCVDVEAAARLAPGMETVERVVRFGNDRLKRQFAQYLSTPDQGLEIFQREFECIVLDDSESYYTMDLIRSCYPAGNSYWFRDAECEGKHEIEKAKHVIDQLARQCQAGLLTGQWAAAMDVGRTHDRSVLTVGHALPEDPTHLALRLLIDLKVMPFPQQEEVWDYLMKFIRTSRGYVDGTSGSIGVQLAEAAHFKYGERAITFEFTNDSKRVISSGLKSRMEKGALIIPNLPSLERQIHSIKKRELPSGGVVFDAERNAHGHADGFWSLAMLSDLLAQPDEVHVFTPRVTHQAPQLGGMRQRAGSHLWVPGGR